MPRAQIDEILAAAKAAENCMKLPEHVRSLAATVAQMASRAAAEAKPDPAALHTLEQAIGILERWLAGYDLDDASLQPLADRISRRQAGPVTHPAHHLYPPLVATL